MSRGLIGLILLLNSSVGLSEYRVFQYLVRPRKKLIQDLKPYLVTSALDPVSYVAYHGGEMSIKIDMLRTWICPGHTGYYKTHCPSPYGKIIESQAFRDIEDKVSQEQ